MKCDCCGKNKRLFESFSILKYEEVKLNLCAKCNDLCFKVRDFSKLKNNEEVNKAINNIESHSKKSSDQFKKWFAVFKQKQISTKK